MSHYTVIKVKSHPCQSHPWETPYRKSMTNALSPMESGDDGRITVKAKFTKISVTQDRLLIMSQMNAKYPMIGAICQIQFVSFCILLNYHPHPLVIVPCIHCYLALWVFEKMFSFILICYTVSLSISIFDFLIFLASVLWSSQCFFVMPYTVPCM